MGKGALHSPIITLLLLLLHVCAKNYLKREKFVTDKTVQYCASHNIHRFSPRKIMKTTHCCFRRSGVNIGYYYGRISGPIWSNNFRCSGNESSLEECRHDGGGYRSCSHQQDVSIVCGNSTCKSRNCYVITALYCRHVILSQRSYIFPRLFIFFPDT